MIGARQEMRRELLGLAHSQDGYFTAAQALDLGYSYQAQKFHADQGNWLRVDRGIFRLPEWPLGQHDSLVRWSLWARGRGVVSHDSALVVHDIGEANPAQVHLTVPPNFRASDPAVCLHRGMLPDDDVEQRQGFSVTTPLRTLLDIAAGNLDLDQLASALSDALDHGLTTRRRLLTRVEDAGDHAALRVERALQRREENR